MVAHYILYICSTIRIVRVNFAWDGQASESIDLANLWASWTMRSPKKDKKKTTMHAYACYMLTLAPNASKALSNAAEGIHHSQSNLCM